FQELQDAASALVVNNEMAELYQRHGGVGLNASTSKDVTRYMVSLPANRLLLWAAIESDRMANPVLREFYKERAVVMEERRLRTEDNPQGLLYEAFTALAFQAHPYQFPTIGWASDIMALTPEDTREFFHTYYGPDNTVVAIVGDINPKEVIALMEREFGAIPRNGSRPRVATVEPRQRGERRVEVEFDAEPAVLIGYHKPGLDHPDDFVFDVIDSILSEGVTSRLYQRLVREKRVAASVKTFSGYPGAKDPSLFLITAVPLAPHTTQEVEAAIYEELERLKTESVSRKELEKVLNSLDADLVRSLRSNSGLASQLAYFQSVAGDWRYILRARERIGAVTPEDIQRVASTHFVKANRTVATLTKPTATPAPQVGTPPPSTMPLGRPAEQSAQEGQEGQEGQNGEGGRS
ncbi:MAG: M16 family metallopeptidase, partial [Nitrospirales bacterium]